MFIAIDPGQHTGIAVRLNNGEWATLLVDKVPNAEDRLNMVLDTLQERMVSGACQTVIVENFKTMGYLSKFGIETIELVGAIKALCRVYRTPMVRQDPVHRLPYERQADGLLKERSRLLKIRVSAHELSALAHLLRYESTLHPSTLNGAPSAGNASPAAGCTSDGSPTTAGPIAFAVKVASSPPRARTASTAGAAGG